jgi:two-component system chemotaxis response regulator CheY
MKAKAKAKAKATVLLVEDNELQRMWYREELEEAGYDVKEAENGMAAMEKAMEKRPDLVVMDIKMPEQDGMKTLRELLALYPHLPVVLNTAYAHYKSSFMTWGADSFIVKSSDTSPLIREVSRLTDMQRLAN